MAEQANQKQPAKFCGARLLPSPAREGGREVGAGGMGNNITCRKNEALQMSRRDNDTVFPLHPERKRGLCAFNEIVFVYKEDFSCCEADGRRFWPR